MASSSSQNNDKSPIPKKKYKAYITDDTVPIPLRSIYRLQKRSAANDDADNCHIPCTSANMNHEVPSYNNDVLADISDSESEDEDSLNGNTSEEMDDDNSVNEDHIANDNKDDLDEDGVSEFDGNDYNENNDESNNVCANIHGNLMLHENSCMTLDESICDLLNYYIRHNITKAALKDALTMQVNMLPENNAMPRTIHQLFKYVHNLAPTCEVIKHFYCQDCLFYIGSNTKIQSCLSCDTIINKDSFFFEFDIFDQIKYLFEHCKLGEKLKQPLTFGDNNVITDITDGSEYIRVNSRPNRNKYDLTLILNTDGISLIKSAKSHCWPILCTIAELPEYLRDSFVISLGLWYDNNCKPSMNVFFRPLSLKLKKCFEEGINWISPTTKETINSRVVAPLIIGDAPARAQLLNILNFNGRYGCNTCEIRTKKCHRVAGIKRHRIYPFKYDARLRDGDRMKVQARQLQQFDKVQIRGVKGYSILSNIPQLDLGTCCPPEFIHSVLLGVVKQLFKLYVNKKGPWNIKKYIDDIDKFLMNIRPLWCCNRMPRRLSHLKYYKASELYNLILYYSIPAFADYLANEYFQNLIALVIALFNLLQTSITMSDLDTADALLRSFVEDIPNLFTDRELTYNVHQLLHLVLSVKRWGPLWANSAFPFENYNGLITKSIHGKKHMGQEIVNNVKICQGHAILRHRVSVRNQNTEEAHASKNYKLLGVNIAHEKLNDAERALLFSNNIDFKQHQLYTRVKLNNEIYTSDLYKKIKTNSHNVHLKTIDNSCIYGLIRCFLEIENVLCFILQKFTVEHDKMFIHSKTRTIIKHIIPIKETNEYLFIKITDLQFIIQVIRVGNYICKRPNILNKIM